MIKTHDRNRLGYASAQAEARPAVVAYDPYFPVVARASGDRAALAASSAGHTVFDPYRPRRGRRMDF